MTRAAAEVMVLAALAAPDVEVGVEVMMQGLVNDPDLNGQCGTVCTGPRRGGRIPVVLQDGECRVRVPVRCLYVSEHLHAYASYFNATPVELAALIHARRDADGSLRSGST